MSPRLALSAASVALLALAGCATPTTPGSDAPATTETSPATEAVADCLLGTWSLDAADLAEQLRVRLTELGLTVTAAQAAGGVTLEVDPGSMVYTSAVTFALTALVGGDGPEMVVTQSQDGVSRGSWTAEGSTLRFDTWQNGLDFTTAATIAGETVDVPLELPAEAFGTGQAAVSCTGSELTTAPEGGLFTSTWTRVG